MIYSGVNTVFDIGSHKGTDTEFYLKKGFRVVAVDANAAISQAMIKEVGKFAKSGQLIVENVGIAQERCMKDFHINNREAEWSSFEPHLASRKGTSYTTVRIPCLSLQDLVEKYCMPYYIKIDIEGYDNIAARSLKSCSSRPRYISIEHGGVDSILALYETGVRKFKFINQVDIRSFELPIPALEGLELVHKFGISSSGPFGLELPGTWLSTEEAFRFYFETIRPSEGPVPLGWWDIHGAY